MNLLEAGFAQKTANALNKRKIFTADDLVRLAPNHYRDYRKLQSAEAVPEGAYAAISGKLMMVNKLVSRKNVTYLMMSLMQDQGELDILSFSEVYNYTKYARYLYSAVVVCGKVSVSVNPVTGESRKQMLNPDLIELISDFRPRVYTIYPNYRGISDQMLRSGIGRLASVTEELLPAPVLKSIREDIPLLSYREAIRELHYPESAESLKAARERLIFNDLLYYAYFAKQDTEDAKYTKAGFPENSFMKQFISSLPYELTEDQKKVISECSETAYQGLRMNYLLLGDVGCGKSVCAFSLMFLAHENGFQSAIMTPREALSRQHYNELSVYAEKYGISCVFLHSGMKAAERKKAVSDIRSGKISFIVGTHSVLSDDVEYKNLALIITDEEHLFGVAQKERLASKAMDGVHEIAMTATPIPRSLAGVLYGSDRKILEIRTMPKGRKPILTCTQRYHRNTFDFIEQELQNGHQCYVICPSIEDSENFPDLLSLEAAFNLYNEEFSEKGWKIGVVNGKMPKNEIAETIDRFSRNDLQILISTTVVEVGMNIPNASILVVENAERFGLASLHQLRGRVGRSDFQSYCILISDDTENERLQAMVRCTSGFEISEMDLEQRGAGNLIGLEQSGYDKYVELMLANPQMYKIARKIVKQYWRTGYLNRLVMTYDEHFREEEKYAEKKK